MRRIPVFFINRLTGLVLLTAVALTGCGVEPDANIKEAVTLIEPETSGRDIRTEPVVRRNLYNATLYPTTVSPYIEKYSFNSNQTFGSYGPLLGDQVSKGDILMAASGEALSGQIEVLEEKLEDLTEAYTEYREEAEENMRDYQKELDRLQDILDELDETEPVSTVSGNDADLSENAPDNPEHASWEALRDRCQSDYNLVEYYIFKGQHELDKQRELYELDFKYYNEQLQELRAKRKDEIIRSDISGVVVALGDYVPGDPLTKEVPVIAVADLTQKFIKCNYIKPILLMNSNQVYAFINGKRYDVVLYDNNTLFPNYTTFILQDYENEVEMGSYVTIVVLSDYREQVLTVRTDSIYTVDTQEVVYVLENGQTVAKEITTGISDSIYTEILSGLSESDAVLVSGSSSAGSSQAVLEKGTFGLPMELTGKLVYPIKTVVYNPVSNGKVFFEEYAVKKNQYVEKGGPLALINVESDLLSLQRREVSLMRRKERLDDLIAMNREQDEETIRMTRESIEEEEERLAQIKADYATTEISAPVSGYVVYLWSREAGELIRSTNEVICHIADESIAYLDITDSNGITPGYNTLLTISYKDLQDQEHTIEGRVLTADNYLLGDSRQDSSLQGNSKVLIPLEARQNMITVGKKAITVQFERFKNENVILVPAEAVTFINNNTYVNILNQDGSVTTVSFLCGGYDNKYYWAIDGLTEGLVICWE